MREEVLYLNEYEDQERKVYKDRCQMKRFYKGPVRDFQKIIELECDKLEYDGSMMYADVMDEVQIYRMAEAVTRQIVADEHCEQIKPWILMLLCNEMHDRRCRKCRRDGMFCR